MKTERKRTCVRIPTILNEELGKVAEYEDVSKNQLIVRELKKLIRQYEKNDQYQEWKRRGD